MTYTVPVKDATWKTIWDHAVSAVLCDDSHVNNALLHEYVVMYLANQRTSGAHTKTRGEVRRSGRKLYRQKWTGRARVWDAGSPIRRKWGVAFGPRSEANYSKKMPKKMRKKAFAWAVTLKVQSGSVVVLKDFGSTEIKTKYAADMLTNVEFWWKKSLVVLPSTNEVMYKSFRNIAGVTVSVVSQMNTYEVMTHDAVLFVGDSLKVLEESFVS